MSEVNHWYWKAFIFALFLSFPHPVEAGEGFEGQIVRVIDRDTIDVVAGAEKMRIRLYGIDSPEKRQSHGVKAKIFMSKLAFGRSVSIRKKGRGRGKFGRLIGEVVLPDEKNLESRNRAGRLRLVVSKICTQESISQGFGS